MHNILFVIYIFDIKVANIKHVSIYIILSIENNSETETIPDIEKRRGKTGIVKSGIKIFTGRANPGLAQEIAGILNVSLGEMLVSKSNPFTIFIHYCQFAIF
jgi:hypothetical protein